MKKLSLLAVFTVFFISSNTQAQYSFDSGSLNMLRAAYGMCETEDYKPGHCPAVYTACWMPPNIDVDCDLGGCDVETKCEEDATFDTSANSVNRTLCDANTMASNDPNGSNVGGADQSNCDAGNKGTTQVANDADGAQADICLDYPGLCVDENSAAASTQTATTTDTHVIAPADTSARAVNEIICDSSQNVGGTFVNDPCVAGNGGTSQIANQTVMPTPEICLEYPTLCVDENSAAYNQNTVNAPAIDLCAGSPWLCLDGRVIDIGQIDVGNTEGGYVGY